jgi:hypothetical protein
MLSYTILFAVSAHIMRSTQNPAFAHAKLADVNCVNLSARQTAVALVNRVNRGRA